MIVILAALYVLIAVIVAAFDHRLTVSVGDDPDWLMTGALSAAWPVTLPLFAVSLIAEWRRR